MFKVLSAVHLISISLVFLFPVSVHAITKTELVKRVGLHSRPVKSGYTARFISNTSIGNTIMNDSGTFYFSPPNRSRVEFLVSKIAVSSCGDTTWTKAANGDVTRSISSGDDAPGNSSGSASFSSPDLLSYLKKSDFIIRREDSIAIIVSFEAMVENRKTPFILSVDPKTFVINRMEFPTAMAGMFQVGYRYRLYEGHPVLEEITTVMGTLGFSRIRISDFRKSKKKRTFFHGF